MKADLLARALQEFLAESAGGVVIEDGEVIFHLDSASYSVSSERGRCLLHFWSAERNLVREVLEAETAKNGALDLSVRGFAQARPHRLEICRNVVQDRDRLANAARKSARSRYAKVLERILHRQAPDWKLEKNRLSTTMDLERSFSPVYARGLLRRGGRALAVLGVSGGETQSAVDAALTFGLLWLDACREREAASASSCAVVEGLRLFVPPGRSSTLEIRMAHLNRGAARFELVELDEREESFTEIDCSDQGNINTHLVRSPSKEQTQVRFAAAIERVRTLIPAAEAAVISPAEVSFRLHGLEFAQARVSKVPGSFALENEIVFGLGGGWGGGSFGGDAGGLSQRLTQKTEPQFVQLLKTVAEARDLGGDRHHPLWRMYPERWLESLAIRNVAAIDARFDPVLAYSQVPAFTASDRAMIDILTRTRESRLAVLELKADEDIHLPLQGLDYWARVWWHHQRGEFQQYGYFPGVELSPRPPLLFLVAPSLRVHPSVDMILRYFCPEIEWALVGVDERWREGIRVIYRKSVVKY